MPYNPQNIPSTPLPVSMMPAATEIQGSDLLLLVQTLQGVKRTRSMPISSLASSAPIKAVSDSKFFYSALPASGAWTLDLSAYTDKHHLEVFFDASSSTESSGHPCSIILPQDYTGIVVVHSCCGRDDSIAVSGLDTSLSPLVLRAVESISVALLEGERLGVVRQYESITSNRLSPTIIADDFSLSTTDATLPPIIASQSYLSRHILDLSVSMQYKVQRSGSYTSSSLVLALVDTETSQNIKSVSVPIQPDAASGSISCRIIHRFTSNGFFKLNASIQDAASFIDYPEFSVMGTYAGTL